MNARVRGLPDDVLFTVPAVREKSVVMLTGVVEESASSYVLVLLRDMHPKEKC